MDKTAEQILTEANLHKTFWGGRIIRAEKWGMFTLDDYVKSSDWTTCACGKQDERIPRLKDIKLTPSSEPVDPVLARYGQSFFNYIDDGEFYKSADTLIKIETRAAEILSGLTQ